MLREGKKKEVRITVPRKFTGKVSISTLNSECFSISVLDQKF